MSSRVSHAAKITFFLVNALDDSLTFFSRLHHSWFGERCELSEQRFSRTEFNERKKCLWSDAEKQRFRCHSRFKLLHQS